MADPADPDPADPVIAFLDDTIALMETRRAAQVALVASVAIGVACLAFGSPWWAAFMFASAVLDLWRVKHWRTDRGR